MIRRLMLSICYMLLELALNLSPYAFPIFTKDDYYRL